MTDLSSAQNSFSTNKIIYPANDFAPRSVLEVFDWVVKINQINHEEILPKLEKYKYKNDLEGFLIQEHFSISRQLKATSTILENISTSKLDIIDCSIIIASQTRSIIENMAVINFLIHDKTFTDDDKANEIHNFKNQAKEWYEARKNKNESNKHELYTEFIRNNNSAIIKN